MDQATLAQHVYQKLHEKLRTGRLRPGARLVNRTIAAELGTSTIPVREAISRLISEGLVQATPGAGAFVRTIDANDLADLYDVREALEALGAAGAARFGGEALRQDLAALCRRFAEIAEEIPPDGHAGESLWSRWLDAEEAFHHRVVQASRNRWLEKMVRDLRVIAGVFAAQRSSPRLLTRALADRTRRQHEAFVRVLAGGDPDAARRWMVEHIRSGRQTVLGHLDVAPDTTGSGTAARPVRRTARRRNKA
jgi:DNA-binding GntR family transcriptional regulator